MNALIRARGLIMQVAAALGLLLVACSDDASGPPGPTEYPVTLTPDAVWAGDAVHIRWGYLGEETPVAFLVEPRSEQDDWLGANEVAFTRESDTTGTLALSRARPGGLSTLLAVLAAGDTVSLGQVDVAGGVDVTGFNPYGSGDDDFWCARYPWPRSEPAGLLFCHQGQVHHAARGGTVATQVGPPGGLTVWPDGFGVSYRPGVVIVPLGPDSVLAWDTESGVAAGRTALAHGGNRAVEIGPDRWVLLHDEGVEVVGGGGGIIPSDRIGRVLFSPAGESVAFLLQRRAHVPVEPLGSAVLRTGDGTLRTRLPWMDQPRAAYASEGVIVQAGNAGNSFDGEPTNKVQVVDLETGAVSHDALLPSSTYIVSLLLDHPTDRIYLAESINHIRALRVLDAATLEELAEIQFGGCGCSIDNEAFLPATDREVTLMEGGSTVRYRVLP